VGGLNDVEAFVGQDLGEGIPLAVVVFHDHDAGAGPLAGRRPNTVRV
jgi:hypothetical protein